MDRLHIMLSAGGTGGHLFPAEALATALMARGHRVTIVTDKRGEAFKSLGPGVAIHTVPAATLKPGLIAKLRACAVMGQGIFSALRLVTTKKPDVVVGFGGYPSFPAVFAAQLLGRRTMLHEQNGVLGKANKALARRARAIALSLTATKGLTPEEAAKATVTGNPVRDGVVAVRDIPYEIPPEPFIILITGGSQAAAIFSDVVPAALAQLPDNARSHLHVMHQCRVDSLTAARTAYGTAGIKAETETFFADIAERLAACQLFIGRSGASTVAEIAVAGRPAIFVPMRHADMQQRHNAESLTATGGGWIIAQEDFTPEKLRDKIAHLMAHHDELRNAASAARDCGQPDAARKLADMVIKQALAGGQKDLAAPVKAA